MTTIVNNSIPVEKTLAIKNEIVAFADLITISKAGTKSCMAAKAFRETFAPMLAGMENKAINRLYSEVQAGVRKQLSQEALNVAEAMPVKSVKTTAGTVVVTYIRQDKAGVIEAKKKELLAKLAALDEEAKRLEAAELVEA